MEKNMEEGGLERIRSEEIALKSHVKELERRVRELERILCRKTLENEILREAIKIGRGKKLILR
jgi:transposase